MRILNEDLDCSVNRVTIYLTRAEARELVDSLEELDKRPKENHSHASSEDFQKEITVCIYDQTDISDFDERSKKIIVNDE